LEYAKEVIKIKYLKAYLRQYQIKL